MIRWDEDLLHLLATSVDHEAQSRVHEQKKNKETIQSLPRSWLRLNRYRMCSLHLEPIQYRRCCLYI